MVPRTVTVGIVSPGAMGSALGRGYVEGGARVVATVAGRSPRTRELAHGVELLPSVSDVVAASDVVISIVPPGEALDVAASVAEAASSRGVEPVYSDLNAISPGRALQVAGLVAPLRFVDGSISGGPPNVPGTRLYLSGPDAGVVAGLHHPRLDVRLLDGPVGMASAVKMSTASVYKGTAALVMQALRTAESNGVLAIVLDDLTTGYPELMRNVAPRLASTASKAHRFVGEMDEIAAAQGDAGLPRELFAGLAAVFAEVATTPLGNRSPEEAGRLRDLAAVLRELSLHSATSRAQR